MDILPIDRMPNLSARLGTVETARIRYAQFGSRRKQSNAKNLDNPILEEMQAQAFGACRSEVADILYGVANAHTGKQALNTPLLFAILQTMPVINTREVQVMTGLAERQARYYMGAIRAALPFLIKILKNDGEKEVSPEDIQPGKEQRSRAGA